MNWYLEVLKKYADFNGRARRKEYWMFALFNILIALVLLIVDGILGTIGLLYGLYLLGILLPSLGVLVRRLHDTGRSGWWVLIAFVPVVGAIILLVFAIQGGTPGENEYGKNPKESFA